MCVYVCVCVFYKGQEKWQLKPRECLITYIYIYIYIYIYCVIY